MKKLLFLLIFYITLSAQTGWSTPRTVSGIYWCSESAITVDNNGVLSAVWCKCTDYGSDYYGSVYFSQSFNGGLSWTAEKNITPGYYIDPLWEIRAVTDSKNNIHILYCKGLAMDKLIYKKYDGVNWSEDYVINFGLDNNMRFNIDSIDRLFATWTLNRTTYYMYYDTNIDPIPWSVPRKIHPTVDYGVMGFTINNDNNIHGVGIYGANETEYRPYYFFFDKSLDVWTIFKEIYNYQEKTIGCAITATENDTLHVNTMVGYSTFENVDNNLKKNISSSTWIAPTETGGFNNDWNRKMFIDKKDILHIFERHRSVEGVHSLTHIYGKGTTWQTETIFSDPDYFIFWFDVKRKVFESYDQYYVLYCLSRGVDGISYSRINYQSKQVSTGIDDSDDIIVNEYALEQNYPNPFNSQTEISYNLSKAVNVKINIFNSKGEQIQNLINEKQNKGNHKITFDAEKFDSGIYFYQLVIENKILETKKMLYLR